MSTNKNERKGGVDVELLGLLPWGGREHQIGDGLHRGVAFLGPGLTRRRTPRRSGRVRSILSSWPDRGWRDSSRAVGQGVQLIPGLGDVVGLPH